MNGKSADASPFQENVVGCRSSIRGLHSKLSGYIWTEGYTRVCGVHVDMDQGGSTCPSGGRSQRAEG